jgi:cell division protein FtsB
MLTQLESILIACLPALASIVGIITAASNILKTLNSLKDNEALKRERDQLSEANKQLIDESRRLQKQVSLLVEKATHIKYSDMSEVKNDQDLQI